MQPNSTPPQHSVHLYKLLAVFCIDHVPPNLQDGCTPLMAADEGHLPVARLLVETYHCDVNEEEDEVSGWEVMGGVSEYSTCVSSHMWPSDRKLENKICIEIVWSRSWSDMFHYDWNGLQTIVFLWLLSKEICLGCVVLRSWIQSCCGSTCVRCVVWTDVSMVPAQSVRFLW